MTAISEVKLGAGFEPSPPLRSALERASDWVLGQLLDLPTAFEVEWRAGKTDRSASLIVREGPWKRQDDFGLEELRSRTLVLNRLRPLLLAVNEEGLRASLKRLAISSVGVPHDGD